MKRPSSLRAGFTLFLVSYVPASYLFTGGLFLHHVWVAPPFGFSTTELLKPFALAPLTTYEILRINAWVAGMGFTTWYVLMGFLLSWLLSFAALLVFMRRRSNAANVAEHGAADEHAPRSRRLLP